ncbi:MAG TPA: methyltransferase domain-containing protein [Planctomycetaceae bacterium]|jgi:SAM-dependent methyltransferase|nr:methyltransferase domain-containing protein [Planctomycetaceae bacterium]
MDETKRIVAAGYDVLAESYLQQFGTSSVRAGWLNEFVRLLPPLGRVLDLGCGPGEPVARRLADAGFEVVGVDVSERQIRFARRNVPAATFHHADMMALELPAASFDGVVAFYSISHLPRTEHAKVFRLIAEWLKPGGLLIASLGVRGSGDWQGEWLGVEMYFSNYDAATSLRLIADAGLTIERTEVMSQDNETAEFLWVVATKGRCAGDDSPMREW